MLEDIVCPDCSGRGGVASGAEEPKPPTWDVQCDLCDWAWKDEYDEMFDEPVINIRDAMTLARQHTCDPAFTFITPQGEVYHSVLQRKEIDTMLVELGKGKST